MIQLHFFFMKSPQVLFPFVEDDLCISSYLIPKTIQGS